MVNDTPLILVVDDNSQNIQFLGSLLMGQAYELGVAQNGVEALKFMEKRLPDLILLDIMMPEMDGLELCRILKNKNELSHIPVIFLTAKSETDDIVKGFDVGGVDYITKPFIGAELLARVKTHLEITYLRDLIPICAHCKKIRDEEGFWNRLEVYFQKHTNSRFPTESVRNVQRTYIKTKTGTRKASNKSLPHPDRTHCHFPGLLPTWTMRHGWGCNGVRRVLSALSSKPLQTMHPPIMPIPQA